MPVTAIYEDGVEVGGERLRSYNVIWAAGVRAAPLVQSLGAELGPGGRVKVQPDCSVPGHPNVFVIGDAAYLVDSKTGKQVPGVSQGALQMGRYVARVIQERAAAAKRRAARARGSTTRTSARWRRSGSPARWWRSGRCGSAGFLAWLAWLALHITVLIGFRNRISVFVSWIYGYVFFRRGSRLITRSVALESGAERPKQ